MDCRVAEKQNNYNFSNFVLKKSKKIWYFFFFYLFLPLHFDSNLGDDHKQLLEDPIALLAVNSHFFFVYGEIFNEILKILGEFIYWEMKEI